MSLPNNFDRDACVNVDKYLGPIDDRKITLERPNGNIKIKCSPKNKHMASCIARLRSWILAATYTLDVALFDLFHKALIQAVIKKQRHGIRCRVILYAFMLQGEKAAKHRNYVKQLEKAGVEIRYCSTMPQKDTDGRMLLIDLFDPNKNYETGNSEVLAVLGKQITYVAPLQHITRDFYDLYFTKLLRCIYVWIREYDRLWDASKVQY